MSLYHMMNGVNQSVFFILPALGKHPDEYPRFRDCFLSGKGDQIAVLTRTGGANRSDYVEEINEMKESEDYLSDHDDSSDSTYACFYFKFPDKWKDDIAKLIDGNLSSVSNEYVDQICKVFPKLEDKMRDLFNKAKEE